MNAEPLGPPPPPAVPQRNWGRRRLLWLIAFALLLVLGVVSVIFLRGRNEDTAQASELFLEEQSSTGDDPFAQNVAQPLPGAIVPSPGVPSSSASSASFLSPSVPPPVQTASGVTAVQSVDGAMPGLYGGTVSLSSKLQEKP